MFLFVHRFCKWSVIEGYCGGLCTFREAFPGLHGSRCELCNFLEHCCCTFQRIERSKVLLAPSYVSRKEVEILWYQYLSLLGIIGVPRCSARKAWMGCIGSYDTNIWLVCRWIKHLPHFFTDRNNTCCAWSALSVNGLGILPVQLWRQSVELQGLEAVTYLITFGDSCCSWLGFFSSL